MSSLRMQPTFTVDLPLSAEEAIKRIKSTISSQPELRYAKSAGVCAEFTVEPDQRRFWSPQLSIQLSDKESGSELFGRFSPRPEIWTFFMFIYFGMACGVFGGMIYGYAQWFMGNAPWALLAIPACIAAIAGLHLASLIGQGLSRDQMQRLRDQLDQALVSVRHPSEPPTADRLNNVCPPVTPISSAR